MTDPNPDTMTEFRCPSCGQEIEINEAIREAILTNGCPVCSSSVAPEHFITP